MTTADLGLTPEQERRYLAEDRAEQAATLRRTNWRRSPLLWWARWYHLRTCRRVGYYGYITSRWTRFWFDWASWRAGFVTFSPVETPITYAKWYRKWRDAGKPESPYGYGQAWDKMRYEGCLTRLTFWVLTRF